MVWFTNSVTVILLIYLHILAVNAMEYGPIPPSKFDDVINHLRFNFPDEPLNASVGLCMHGQPCELLEHHDLMTLKDGLSVMAVDKETGVVCTSLFKVFEHSQSMSLFFFSYN